MKIFFSNVFMMLGFLWSISVVNADVDGIPYNSEFPKAQYPYAQAPDACSGVTNRPDSNGEIKDNWGSVNFRGACNTHDKCYYTLGSDWNDCNEQLYSNLRAACERDLRIGTPLGKLPPDPVRLTACYSIATIYYAGVQGGVAAGVFDKAQSKQRKYEEWISSIRSQLTKKGEWSSGTLPCSGHNKRNPTCDITLDSGNGCQQTPNAPGNQCSFPKGDAIRLCSAHPQCFAVTCSPTRNDCQARSKNESQSSPVKSGGFSGHQHYILN